MFNVSKGAKTNTPNQRKYSFYFVVIALIISAVSFLLLLEKYKQYASEFSIIFVPKSEVAVQDAERIIENMEILPTKMFFYDRMATYDENIGDKISNFSDIRVEREKNGSIMKISALAKNKEDSIAVSRIAATTLFNIMGFYYDIKKDANFRIIDGPVAHVTITNWLFILVYSLLAGALSLLAINFIFQNIFSRARKEEKPSDFFDIQPKTKIKPEIRKVDEAYEIKAKPKTIPVPIKQSPAPENLPFIDEDYFRNNIIKGVEPEPSSFAEASADEEIFEEIVEVEEPIEAVEEIKLEEPTDSRKEPTQEELKRRLNQLLKGEL